MDGLGRNRVGENLTDQAPKTMAKIKKNTCHTNPAADLLPVLYHNPLKRKPKTNKRCEGVSQKPRA